MVLLCAGTDPYQRGQVHAARHGACVSGQGLEDTGLGIRAEDLPRIFECGFTGYNGRGGQRSTGLGLYLCHEVLQRLGHTISIRSEPGKGTAVCICFARGTLVVE